VKEHRADRVRRTAARNSRWRESRSRWTQHCRPASRSAAACRCRERVGREGKLPPRWHIVPHHAARELMSVLAMRKLARIRLASGVPRRKLDIGDVSVVVVPGIQLAKGAPVSSSYGWPLMAVVVSTTILVTRASTAAPRRAPRPPRHRLRPIYEKVAISCSLLLLMLRIQSSSRSSSLPERGARLGRRPCALARVRQLCHRRMLLAGSGTPCRFQAASPGLSL